MSSVPASPITRPRLRVSRRRRFLFGTVLGLATWLCCELISLAALSLFFEGRGEIVAAIDRGRRVDPLGPRVGPKPEVLHPFVGYVRRPETTAAATERFPVTEFGYLDSELPLHTRSPDRMLVAIVGGSVAEQFATGATDHLERELKTIPQFAGKKLEFVRVALSGYKQPQQLMTIAYLLSLGAEFDLVLNIDGYNEIVLPIVENRPAHVFPSYPRVWQARVTETTDTTVLRMVGRISYLQSRSQDLAAMFGRPPVRYSPTLNLVWAVLDKTNQQSMNREFAAFNALKSRDHDYILTGPEQEFADDDAYYEHCATIWRTASWQLHQLCAANGIRYYHFLQPNQYVPGSKTMADPIERQESFSPGHVGAKHVELGYPVLIRHGVLLPAAGVRFHDLTGLFADHPERTYADRCCHYNQHGNEILARRIAELISHDLGRD